MELRSRARGITLAVAALLAMSVAFTACSPVIGSGLILGFVAEQLSSARRTRRPGRSPTCRHSVMTLPPASSTF